MPMLIPYGDPPPDKSSLPPGGDPAADAAYERWLAGFVDEANSAWLDDHGPDLPNSELVRSYQITGHLHHWLIGWKFASGTGPNVLHRLRFVAIQFRLRPHELIEEARRYVTVLKVEAKEKARIAAELTGVGR